MRRFSYVFLCLVPVLVVICGGMRALRVSGVYQSVGVVLFGITAAAAWFLGARNLSSGEDEYRKIALAGTLLIAPFALILLLWVGLGTPWEATPAENQMRYLVLLFGSISITGGLIVLERSLERAGEGFYSTLGFAANILAGAAYLVWLSFQLGFHTIKARGGQFPPALVPLGDVLDILLFAACVLTYLATAAFAASLGKVGWLGRGPARAYLVVALVALVFLLIRGLSFPDPTADETPWFLRPGFIAGIPAIPWIVPYLFGVIMLKRAGNEQS